MSRPTSWLRMVRAAKNEALLAVKLYNDPMLERSLEGFGVHMHLAWLYLLQAGLIRDGKEIRYRDPHHRGRFEVIDDEHRTWELQRCVKERWPDPDDPVRANLTFFIKFRNKTEHRYKGQDAVLLTAVADKSQALLLNFEEELVSSFGSDHTLAAQLRFPVFIGTFTEPATHALRRLRNSLPADLKTFLAEYDSGLNKQTAQDSRYSLRLKVHLQPAQNGEPDMAIHFVRADELTPEESAKLSEVGQTGAVVIKERNIPVSNEGLLNHTTVWRSVNAVIPFRFNQSHLTAALRREDVRPVTGDKRPERTKSEFCVYDELHKTYAYTQTYVDYLIRQCRTEAGFKKTTGRDPELHGEVDVLVESNVDPS